MKRFIIRTVLLILIPTITCVVLCEHFLRKIPNDYSFKSEWLAKESSSVEVLSLGSSHGFYGINPVFFSEKAFNAAHVSQTIRYDHFIFTKFVDEMDSLKILVLPLSYGSFFDVLENSIEDWRVKYYSIYYGCNFHRFEPKYNLEIYYGMQFINVYNSMLGKVNHRTCNELGWGTTYKFEERSEDWEETGETAAKRHTSDLMDTSVFEESKELVEDIILKCKQKNVQVILLTIPTYETYRENLNPKQLVLTTESCVCWEKQYDNVHYLNLIADDRFGPDDFFDADHLNEFGAEKLTLILQQTIDSVGISNAK